MHDIQTNAGPARWPSPFGDAFWRTLSGILIAIVLADIGVAFGVAVTILTGESTSFWYLSRAAGFVAYLLLWGSVVWGLLLSTKIVAGRIRPPVVLDTHQFLSSMALGFALFHGLILMGDEYLSFPLQAILIPLAGDYEPLLVAAGQLAMWFTLLLIVSFYARRWIGQKQWRLLHFASFPVYGAALVHGALLGTDSSLLWVQLLYCATGGVVLFLTIFRILTLQKRPGKRYAAAKRPLATSSATSPMRSRRNTSTLASRQ